MPKAVLKRFSVIWPMPLHKEDIMLPLSALTKMRDFRDFQSIDEYASSMLTISFAFYRGVC